MIARHLVALLAIPLTAACASSSNAPAPASPPAAPATAAHDATPAPPADIDGATAHNLVRDGATLVDVRTPAEYAQKHIEGAVNVPVDEVASHDFGDKSKPIIVYCGSGRRAARARDALKSRGYTKAMSVGGMSDWDK